MNRTIPLFTTALFHGGESKRIAGLCLEAFFLNRDQRIKTFNFYVILLAASIGATFQILEKWRQTELLFACGSLHIVVAIIFLLIDQRSRRLLQIPKKVLFDLETEAGWNLFRRDNDEMVHVKNQIVSYTFAFTMTFAVQVAFGIWVIAQKI